MDLLNYLAKDDTYSMLAILLFATSGNPKYATLNELVYLLDNRSFINLMKYYEGQTIKIPSIEETTKALKLLLLYQYYEVEGMDWELALKKAGYDTDKFSSLSARTSLQHFREKMGSKKYRIGGIKNVVKGNGSRSEDS